MNPETGKIKGSSHDLQYQFSTENLENQSETEERKEHKHPKNTPVQLCLPEVVCSIRRLLITCMRQKVINAQKFYTAQEFYTPLHNGYMDIINTTYAAKSFQPTLVINTSNNG